MKKYTHLKLIIGLSFTGLGIAAATITSLVTPWSVFDHNSFTGIKDSRFYSFDNYETKSAEYQNVVYEQLKSSDSTATDSAGTATTNSTDAKPQANASTGQSAPVNNPTGTTASNNSTSSSSAMSGITIAEADGSPYNRSEYGSGWDVSGPACNIRATILKQLSTVAVQTAQNGCTVTYGSWVDPYSGATLTGNPYQGDGTANDLDIDHVIPLKYVNSHGGYNWSQSAKTAYGKSITAMNNGVYLAVSASENRKKGDSGPADYYPSNPNFYCEYSKRWRDTARIYSISLSSRDYDKIKGVLAECNIN